MHTFVSYVDVMDDVYYNQTHTHKNRIMNQKKNYFIQNAHTHTNSQTNTHTAVFI